MLVIVKRLKAIPGDRIAMPVARGADECRLVQHLDLGGAGNALQGAAEHLRLGPVALFRGQRVNRGPVIGLSACLQKPVKDRLTEEGYAPDLTDVEIEEIGRDPFLIAYALITKVRIRLILLKNSSLIGCV